MRVLFLDHFICHGGAQEYLVDIVNRFAENDESSVECMTTNIPFDSLSFSAPNIIKTGIDPFKRTNALEFILTFFITIVKLKKYLSQNEVDLIHCNNVPVLLIARLIRRKQVIFFTVHDFITGAFKHKLIDYCSDKIIAVSESIKLSLTNDLIVKKEIRTIYNGLDLHKRNKLHSNNQKLTFGIACRIIPWKGVDLFIKAALEILKKNRDVRFLIYGVFEDMSYARYIKTLLKGCEEYIVIKDFEKDKANLYNTIDVLVNASVEPEPFGRTLVEAGFFNIPVIGPDVGGPSEIIINKKTGLLFKFQDYKSLSNCMNLFLENEYLIEEYGKNNCIQSSTKFSLDTVSKEIEQFYKDAINENKN